VNSKPLTLVAIALAASSCALPGSAATSTRTGTLLAVVVDELTGMPLGSTLASVRSADKRFRSDAAFTPVDSSGVLRLDGLAFGRYAVYLKRIGYFPKDTIFTVSSHYFQARIPLRRDPVTLQ
jgi:hypothetical protein